MHTRAQLRQLAHWYSAATSHRLPGAAAETYLMNFMVSVPRMTRLSALACAWIEVTPAEFSSTCQGWTAAGETYVVTVGEGD